MGGTQFRTREEVSYYVVLAPPVLRAMSRHLPTVITVACGAIFAALAPTLLANTNVETQILYVVVVGTGLTGLDVALGRIVRPREESIYDAVNPQCA